MDIKVLGTGCKKCIALYNLINEAITELGIQANVEKVEEITKIVQYGVMLTPGLVINGKVKMSGKVLSKADVKKYIQEEM
ncbi:redox-active disulfide protein 2 [Candidatus Desulfosporosinus infrequens]|uniref:Redox-active disulfide protein 2 n=1 Tax=Candidatus Desulfosporosinus infrequens TaxID=2043169 RepID=A0A2U3LBD1_9FIRM|nr:redox-active disulfide protein 2 [Candidatus Desulfosporosinus infrequens]